MSLVKQDYENLVKILESVEIKGLSSARYIADLASKLESRVASWYDGHPSGWPLQDISKDSAENKPVEQP